MLIGKDSGLKKYNKIGIRVVPDYLSLCKIAADLVILKIKEKPQSNLLVPTGSTPIGVYRELSQQSPSLFSKVNFFNFDEYCVYKDKNLRLISPDDPSSYRYFMKTHLLDSLNIQKSYFPDEKNIEQEGAFDELIIEHGGIDLCINAMGEDGHIFGFNFPGSSFLSKTRLVTMNSDTIKVNTKITGQEVPDYAITTGIQTGMLSREILFLVSGKRKAKMLHEVVYGPIEEPVPASILRKHKNCHWIVDEAAASLL